LAGIASQAAPKSAHRRGTSGDAERSFTSRLFGASTAADVNAAFGEANRRCRADPKDKPIAVMWEK
jgi:hypothetical protein